MSNWKKELEEKIKKDAAKVKREARKSWMQFAILLPLAIVTIYLICTFGGL